MFKKLVSYINDKMIESTAKSLALQAQHSDYIKQARPEYDYSKKLIDYGYRIDDETGEIIYNYTEMIGKPKRLIDTHQFVTRKPETEQYKEKLVQQETAQRAKWLETQLKENNITAVYEEYVLNSKSRNLREKL